MPDRADIAILTHRVETLHTDFGEIRDILRDMSNAIVKLALVEERQAQAALAQERCFKIIEKLETRVEALEVAAPMQKQTSAWIMSGVWAAAGLSVTFIAKQLGLI